VQKEDYRNKTIENMVMELKDPKIKTSPFPLLCAHHIGTF